MRRVLSTLIFAIAISWCSIPTPAGEMYKWIDEDGIMHFVALRADVPEKYRDEVLTIVSSSTPDPELAAPSQLTVPPESSLPATDNSALRRFEIPYENEGSDGRRCAKVRGRHDPSGGRTS